MFIITKRYIHSAMKRVGNMERLTPSKNYRILFNIIAILWVLTNFWCFFLCEQMFSIKFAYLNGNNLNVDIYVKI